MSNQSRDLAHLASQNNYSIVDKLYALSITKNVGAAVPVLLWMMRNADGAMSVRSTAKDIASSMELCARTVGRALKVLVELGYIDTGTRFKAKIDWRTTLYTVTL